MSYSRRQLEAFGEPLGDSVTRTEAGRTIYGGGGSSSAPAQQTVTNDLPPWAQPYAKEVLGVGSSLGFTRDPESGKITGFQPYQQYQGERNAQFTPLQQQAFQGLGSLQTPTGIGGAADKAGGIADTAFALNGSYNPT